MQCSVRPCRHTAYSRPENRMRVLQSAPYMLGPASMEHALSSLKRQVNETKQKGMSPNNAIPSLKREVPRTVALVQTLCSFYIHNNHCRSVEIYDSCIAAPIK